MKETEPPKSRSILAPKMTSNKKAPAISECFTILFNLFLLLSVSISKHFFKQVCGTSYWISSYLVFFLFYVAKQGCHCFVRHVIIKVSLYIFTRYYVIRIGNLSPRIIDIHLLKRLSNYRCEFAF